MRYEVQFQYRRKAAAEPSPLAVPFAFSPELLPALLPATGDHVVLGGGDRLVRYVESRIYMYAGEGADQTCTINIVLTDSEMEGLASLVAKD